MAYQKNSIYLKILNELSKSSGPLSARNLIGIASYDAIRKALSRLSGEGEIRRLRRGYYDIPKQHSLLGELSPDTMAVIKSIMDESKARWQVSGAYAANLLGLSEQVPAKIVVLSDSIARDISIGRQVISCRRASPRNLLAAGTKAGLVFQALRFLGKNGVFEKEIYHLDKIIDDATKSKLRDLAVDMPVWMRPIINQLKVSDHG